jgi:deoxyhypusine synthase
VDKDTYQQATESMQADYSMLMPFLVKALLENRARYEKMAKEIGEEATFAKEPNARGYLRPREGYRLFGQREELVTRLNRDVAANRDWLMDSIRYLVA